MTIDSKARALVVGLCGTCSLRALCMQRHRCTRFPVAGDLILELRMAVEYEGKPCPRCHGKGQVPDAAQQVIVRTASTVCPACHGHREL
jgi:hypothetical protein